MDAANMIVDHERLMMNTAQGKDHRRTFTLVAANTIEKLGNGSKVIKRRNLNMSKMSGVVESAK